jgi:hemerythrin-like domain-containing protein
MANPLHVLRHEHRVIEQVLRAFYGICLRLEWGEQIAPEALAGFLDFTSNFVDKFHHAKEEKYLFPALERVIVEPMAAMGAEHQLEKQLTEELGWAVEAYIQGDLSAGSRFVEAARSYSNHLLGHMQREDGVLLRLADELLSDKEKASLAEEFRKAVLEFGRNEEYERMATELETIWAV